MEPNPEFCAVHRALGYEILQYACADYDRDEVPFFVVDQKGVEYEGGKVTFEAFSALGVRYAAEAPEARQIMVNVRTCESLLTEHAPDLQTIDILSIDVEGWELEVLRGLDFEKRRPRVVIVENIVEQAGNLCRDFLTQKGYSLWRHVGTDDVYERLSAANISA